MFSVLSRSKHSCSKAAFLAVPKTPLATQTVLFKRLNSSNQKDGQGKLDSEKPSLLKLDSLLESELKKASQRRALQNDANSAQYDFNSVSDSASKVFLNRQIHNNLKITRGIKGGSQIKVNNNTSSMLNNNLGVLSQSILHTNLDDLTTNEGKDEYGTLKTSKKLRNSPKGNIVVTKSLSAGLMHLTKRQQQNNLRFNLKLRERHMRPSKVKRAQKTRTSAKKFDEGWSDYMSVVHAMIRRGYA